MSTLPQSVYTRTKELEILKDRMDELDKFIMYEMIQSIGTDGEDDVVRHARELQNAMTRFHRTLKLYQKENT